MPRFVFNIVGPMRTYRDWQGRVRGDAQAAIEEAHVLVHELTRPNPDGTRQNWHGCTLQVLDEDGGVLVNMNIGEKTEKS